MKGEMQYVSDLGLLRGQSTEDEEEEKRRPRRTPETHQSHSSITRGCNDEAKSESADADWETAGANVVEGNEAADERKRFLWLVIDWMFVNTAEEGTCVVFSSPFQMWMQIWTFSVYSLSEDDEDEERWVFPTEGWSLLCIFEGRPVCEC